jgi:ketosteroid isomerase-like protein
MRIRSVALFVGAAALAGCATAAPPADLATLQKQVEDTERAFAHTMAARDLAGFGTFLADETIFFNGPQPLRGKAAVIAAWKSYYEKPQPPFSWEPDHVEVLDSGTLALSTGPVHDPDGTLVGRFNSIWRREKSGAWRIVFDKGSPVCDTKKN